MLLQILNLIVALNLIEIMVFFLPCFEEIISHIWLLVQKPIGLVSLLDEESKFPKATDTTFANKLNQHLKANSCFKGERGRGFRVSHYAGEVC